MTKTLHPAQVSQADAFGVQSVVAHGGLVGQQAADALSIFVGQEPKILSVAVASGPGWRGRQAALGLTGYLNPLRAVSHLVSERIDEGVDFAGTGPVYAIGDAIVTKAGYNGGWPGGGYITYQLTAGPYKGLMVYLAEDVTAAVRAGTQVTPSTVIGHMFNGGDGIETGWAEPNGDAAESALAVAGGIGGYGPFPTAVGVNFDELLQALGVRAAPNFGQPVHGLLPTNYPVLVR